MFWTARDFDVTLCTVSDLGVAFSGHKGYLGDILDHEGYWYDREGFWRDVSDREKH